MAKAATLRRKGRAHTIRPLAKRKRGGARGDAVRQDGAAGGKVFEFGFRADIIVEKMIIIEVKSVENIQPVHKKQLLTYLKLTNLKLGLLLNFNTALLKDGIVRAPRCQ